MRKLLILTTVASLLMLSSSSPLIPITGSGKLDKRHSIPPLGLKSHESPPHSFPNEADQISHVEGSGYFLFTVVEQPQGNSAFVSNKPGTLTHFRLAEEFGTIGLIAHNSQAGAAFFDLKIGDQIKVIYKSQDIVSFQIRSIRKFQALSPNSTESIFIDLENGTRYTASDLFLEIYGSGANLVLQTCLERNGLRTWGRLFVSAKQIPDNLPFENPTSEFIQTQTFRILAMK